MLRCMKFSFKGAHMSMLKKFDTNFNYNIFYEICYMIMLKMFVFTNHEQNKINEHFIRIRIQYQF